MGFGAVRCGDRVSSRREQALTAAIVRASPALLGYFQRRIAVDDAPDLLGETMVTAWRRVGDAPSRPEEVRMWLFGIARGVLLNYGRGERRRWALIDRLRGAVPTRDSHAGADDGIEARDAIARLPAEGRELIELVYWEGLTLAQAAAIVGIPASTARSRYAKAKERLKDALLAGEPTRGF
ncbi:sigma-70 family RNA polymerase sigma factor [Microbacterium sp. NPDC080005]|uniref:RNA polymerase sigma factor n=1 Tax=Microbacterium sp. NPDC080005 TaxID=3155288 RepID=UPI00344DC4DC